MLSQGLCEERELTVNIAIDIQLTVAISYNLTYSVPFFRWAVRVIITRHVIHRI